MLGKLRALVLKNCPKLKALPNHMEQLTSLRLLDLTAKKAVCKIPAGFAQALPDCRVRGGKAGKAKKGKKGKKK